MTYPYNPNRLGASTNAFLRRNIEEDLRVDEDDDPMIVPGLGKRYRTDDKYGRAGGYGPKMNGANQTQMISARPPSMMPSGMPYGSQPPGYDPQMSPYSQSTMMPGRSLNTMPSGMPYGPSTPSYSNGSNTMPNGLWHRNQANRLSDAELYAGLRSWTDATSSRYPWMDPPIASGLFRDMRTIMDAGLTEAQAMDETEAIASKLYPAPPEVKALYREMKRDAKRMELGSRPGPSQECQIM